MALGDILVLNEVIAPESIVFNPEAPSNLTGNYVSILAYHPVTVRQSREHGTLEGIIRSISVCEWWQLNKCFYAKKNWEKVFQKTGKSHGILSRSECGNPDFAL